MIALIQRVSSASVSIDNNKVGEIQQGLLALIGIEKTDSEQNASKLLNKILGYRIFADAQDRMNLSVSDIEGGLLLVPQFTLVADTQKGMRPSFSSAGSPEHGNALFTHLVELARKSYTKIESGQFGADMQVSLVNEGPVTFWLQV